MDFVKGLFSKLTKSTFFAAGLMVGLSTLFKILSIFAITKYISVRFGPETLGLYGQSQSFINLIVSFATLSSAVGITKFLAEYKSHPVLRSKISIAAWDITIICSALVSVVVVLFSSPIARLVFFSERYSLYVVFIGLSVFFLAAYKTKLAILNGYQQFKTIASWEILQNILSCLVIILTTLLIRDSVILSISVVYIISFLLMNRKIKLNPLKIFKRIKLLKPVMSPLVKYSVLIFMQTSIGFVIEIVLRSYLVHKMSLTDLGFYEGMNKIIGAILLPVSSLISIYFLPIFSDKQSGSFNKIIFGSLTQILPLMVIVLCCVFFLDKYIIRIILSEKFVALNEYMLIQLIGLFFSVINLIYLNALLGRGLIKLVFVLSISNSLMLLIANFILINQYQLKGVFMSYTLVSFTGLIIYILVHYFLNKTKHNHAV